jgi:preprotein translocase subunit SecY
VILSILQSFTIAGGLMSMGQGVVINPGYRLHPADDSLAHYRFGIHHVLGEQISERGVGNGMSLIIFTGIVVGLPGAIENIYQNVFGPTTGTFSGDSDLGDDGGSGRVHRAGGARRTADPGAVRQARGGTPGDGRTIHPHALKVNAGGVIPVIFASSILAFRRPSRPCLGEEHRLARRSLKSIQHGEPLYYCCFVAASSSSASSTFRSFSIRNEAADNMRKYGGFIPASGRDGIPPTT